MELILGLYIGKPSITSIDEPILLKCLKKKVSRAPISSSRDNNYLVLSRDWCHWWKRAVPP